MVKKGTIEDVYYVPDLKSNILSMGQLLEKGYSIFMKDRMLHLKDKKGQLLAHVEMTKNRMFKLNLRNVRERCLQVNMEDKALLWHLRFTHLRDREEQLRAREKDGLQKLLEQHSAKLELKCQEFESELEKRRESFELDLKDKLKSIEKREMEITRRGDQISKREQTLETRAQKLGEKVIEVQYGSKALKNQEQDMKNKEAKLSEEISALDQEKIELNNSKVELESLKATQ